MNKAISISLFRVSSDSKYLDMVFSCPEHYYFTSLQLEVRYLDNGSFKSSFFDLSAAIFGQGESLIKDQTRWTVRLPLEKIGITIPAIYKATFKVDSDTEEDEINPDVAVCSDVNLAYRCMLDDLFMNTGTCEDLVPDEVIRKYLLLYGHQSALAVKDFETAETYFKLIGNCFNLCGSNGRGSGSCCGGAKAVCGQTALPMPPVRHSCNCGK